MIIGLKEKLPIKVQNLCCCFGYRAGCEIKTKTRTTNVAKLISIDKIPKFYRK